MKFSDFKSAIKEKLNFDNRFCDVGNEEACYIWIGTKNGIIGNDSCHYEFYLEKKKIYVDTHFEDPKNCKNFKKVGNVENIHHIPWNDGDGNSLDAVRINEEGLDINSDSIVDDAWNLLCELDKKIGAELEMILATDRITEYKNLLLNTHNIILHGAPGTRKTYLAKEIAKAMGCTDDEIGFVQFHPSYDYTDFVEGLRPVNSNNGQIGFERKDGVFKAFCKKSLFQEYKKTIPMTKVQDSSFEIVYKSLLEDVKTGKISSYETSRGSQPLRLKDERLLYRKNSPRTESEENIQLMYEYFLSNGIYDLSNYDKKEYWRLISKLTDGQTKTIDYPEYGWTLQVLLDRAKNFEMKKSSEYVDSDEPIIENKTKKPFIFIIDEINRGEISKIFGELFFSIDPGYRGINGKIKTQYQNLIEEGDAFYDGFYVPENVYIIGTMNDIDRSVESMDFAFRRRFTFKEIKANQNLGMLDELDDSIREKAKKAILSLNNAIWDEEAKTGIEGLSSAYHIGGAYFLKLKELDNDFDKLWEYHLEGLLREYLRGMEDAEKSLEQLKEAYEKAETSSDAEEAKN